MAQFAQVTHREWIAAPADAVHAVHAQFADLDHPARRNVRAASPQDNHDIETVGYPQPDAQRAAPKALAGE